MEELKVYASRICELAGKDKEFCEEFVRRLEDSELLREEFLYYIKNQDFLCKMNICGITVTDILVWQVDKFKSGLDEGKFALKYDPSTMVLMAFYAMYDVEKNPEEYLENFRTVTGTDYENKFN